MLFYGTVIFQWYFPKATIFWC
uniref:Uncharacterized protein n=1 Tax=Arundo donax TaxID=35708 RepID=A0A0A9C371_ARUDO